MIKLFADQLVEDFWLAVRAAGVAAVVVVCGDDVDVDVDVDGDGDGDSYGGVVTLSVYLFLATVLRWSFSAPGIFFSLRGLWLFDTRYAIDAYSDSFFEFAISAPPPASAVRGVGALPVDSRAAHGGRGAPIAEEE